MKRIKNVLIFFLAMVMLGACRDKKSEKKDVYKRQERDRLLSHQTESLWITFGFSPYVYEIRLDHVDGYDGTGCCDDAEIYRSGV